MKLTERDRGVIKSIKECRYLTINQIAKLYFPSKQTAQRRLNKMLAYNKIKQIKINGSMIYFINKPPHRLFLDHLLAINSFRIDLTLACRNSEIRLVKFIPESKQAVGGLRHRADALFLLEKEGKRALFFLELDRGTESINGKIFKMFNFYLLYMIYGGFRQKYEVSRLWVTVVTTSSIRLANMRKLTMKLEFFGKYLQYIWLATINHVSEETIFNNIWQSLSYEDKYYGIS